LTNVPGGVAGSDTYVQFNQNGSQAGDAGMVYSGTGSLTLSSSNDNGLLEAVLNFGAASTYIGAEEDDGDVVYSIKSSVYGIDISGSAESGVVLHAGTGADAPVAVQGQGGFKVLDGDGENTVAAISVAGAISGSSTLQVGGAVTMQGLGTATVDLTNDLMVINDAASGVITNTSLAAYSTAIAGAGLTATAVVLSVDARATPQEIGDANGTLKEGMNFATGSISAARTWTLPASPDTGDVVSVKAPGNAATYNITVARAGSQEIDGETSLILESNYGAVDLVYVTTNVWSVK